MKFITSTKNKLMLLSISVFLVLIGTVFHTQHASALTTIDIPNSIIPAICDYDSTSGDPNKYQTGGWISQAGVPTNNVTINVPYNTQTVNLQLNRWIFVYHELVTGAVQTPAGCNFLPADGTPTASAVLGINNTRISSLTATNGSITSYAPGTITSIPRSNTSRYWFNNPVTFTYNHGSPMTTSQTITITSNAQSVNTFRIFTPSQVSVCVANGPSILVSNPTDFDNVNNPAQPCPNTPSNFTLTINVAPPPTSFTARPCMSPAVCNVTQNPDDEAPTTADFTSEIAVSISRPIPTVVKDVTVTESYYVTHYNGSPNTVLLTVGPRKIDLSPPIQTFVHNGLVLPPGIVPGDEICLRLTVLPQSGTVDNSGNIITPGIGGGPSLCDPVFAKPYLSVFQNDVIDGGGFGSTGCAQTSGGIIAFLRNGISGSGSQLATFALGSINFDPANKLGFVSSKLRGGATAPFRPNGLTFANNAPTVGNFGGSNCVTQYEMPTSPSYPTYPQDISSLTSGIYYKTASPAVINPTNPIPTGTHLTLYVNGDLVIRKNITYAGSGGWASSSDIPSLTIIASGDIKIDNGVTELDGIYVSHGTIYTCSNDTSLYGINGLFNNCGLPLTVYGSLLANNIKWYRMYSTLHNSKAAEDPYDNPPVNSAETIISGPEEYLPTCDPLTACSIGGGSTGSNTKYDAITGLPPVL